MRRRAGGQSQGLGSEEEGEDERGEQLAAGEALADLRELADGAGRRS